MRAAQARLKLHREADRRWLRLERQHPELTDTIDHGRRLVTLLIDERPAAPSLTLTAQQVSAKLAAGLPLLDDEALDFDLPRMHRFAMLLCGWAGEQPLLATAAAEIQQALASGILTIDALLSSAANDGEETHVGITQGDIPLDPALLRTVAGLTLSAGLIDLAQRLMPLVRNASIPWNAPFCPICGGEPLLAELQGSGGERMLRCTTCGGGWRILVSQCAHCGTNDSTMLHYLAAEGEEGKYRIDLCDRCQGAMKGVTTFAATPPELLVIEDAALLHLMQEARARGYTSHPIVDRAEPSDVPPLTSHLEG